MEGNFRAEGEPPLAGNIGCGAEFTRSSLDAMTAGENSEDSSEDVMPDEESEWTDEKHNLYLHCLEVSFVKQLHQSKRMLAHSPQKNQRGRSISQKQLINARNTSEQFNVLWNCWWHKIDDAKCEPLSSGVSVDSNPPPISKAVYSISRIGPTGMPGSPSSTDMSEFLKLCSVMEYGKRMRSCGLETPSEEYSSNKPSHEHLLNYTTEGIGQNFPDEGIKKLPDFESRAKRLKTVSADISIQDQITPSRN